jgi:hypothetical protein
MPFHVTNAPFLTFLSTTPRVKYLIQSHSPSPNSSTILKYSSQAPKCIQETKGLSSSSSCLFAACMSPPSSMADLVLQYDNLASHLTGSRSSRLTNHPVAEACKNVLFAHVLDNFMLHSMNSHLLLFEHPSLSSSALTYRRCRGSLS